MKNFKLYNEYCILRGISACRYESIKQFAREFPEYCSYKKWGAYGKSTWFLCSER